MKNRIYRVTFNVKKNKRYHWYFIDIPIKSMKDAKEEAKILWEQEHSNCVKPPHMFHVMAIRINAEDSIYGDGFREIWRNKVYNMKGKFLGEMESKHVKELTGFNI